MVIEVDLNQSSRNKYLDLINGAPNHRKKVGKLQIMN